MRVHVTREDIQLGSGVRPDVCAIALAIRRVRPSTRFVSIGPDTFNVDWQRGPLPAAAQRFVTRFDMTPPWLRRWLVRPITFELAVQGGR